MDEMPGEIWVCDRVFGASKERTQYMDNNYIRRAVTKEEADEALEYLECGVSCPPVIYNTLRKLLEAHK